MNKKFLTTLFVIAMIVLSLAILVSAARAGMFVNADFFAPDYANGASDSFDVGESRTFNYQCACGDVTGNSVCSGNIILEVDAGSGFAVEKSSACSAGENQVCSASHTKVFDSLGIYTFRVFCDENAGTDYTQPSGEHIVLTVESTGCVEGDIRSCDLQSGVCEGSVEICIGGAWPGCDYSSILGYEDPEATCDSLDNDCDGVADNVDGDGDGSSACGGMGVVNELLITTLDSDQGKIDIFEYNSFTQQYEVVWSVSDSRITANSGGEIGDVTHDGVNDFVLTRDSLLEVWTYDFLSDGWYMVWRSSEPFGYMGDIGDFDNDGQNEILVDGSGPEIWGTDAVNSTSFSMESRVKSCSVAFITAAGDLNNNGVPEIFFRCGTAGDDLPLEVWEWTGSAYEWQADVVLPVSDRTAHSMLVDDIECNGDLDRDGVNECILCGNTGGSHLLDYFNGIYSIAYNTPLTSDGSLTQTCSVGDVTNDGFDDWFDVSNDGVRVFSYNGNDYVNVWNSADTWSSNSAIGTSFAGDSDNDGRGEIFAGSDSTLKQVYVFESDTVDATSFENTFNFMGLSSSKTNIMIGNLNPYNDAGEADCDDNNENRYPGATEICGNGVDEDCDGSDLECVCVDGDGDGYDLFDAVACQTGDDCNDNDFFVNPGVDEVCDDGIDNNCNNEIDEGCSSGPFCGDGYCDGKTYIEDCRTCPADCWAGERGACCGDAKCDISKGESAAVCPVDCS